MIHAIRKLARAIHRRSVWQVLVTYLLSAWVLWRLALFLTQTAGIPSWAPTFTLVLLVVMLPLVVATAAVQGGLPGLRIEDVTDPNELPGLTPEQVHVVPEAHPLYGSRLFTWKNMVLGGVTSAALLVTSVVAYMTMWALGIGPVGSLLAQGLVQEQELVALAPFVSDNEDGSLALLVTDVFELELARSPVVNATRNAPPDTRLIVSGTVSRRGPDHLVSARLATSGGSTLAQFEESSSDARVLVAAVRLSERLRERLGESLRVIREAERLAPISTESDEALVLYRLALTASLSGDGPEAIAHLRAAVDIDGSFAMAWYRLGGLAEDEGDLETAKTAYQAVIDLWGSVEATERTVLGLRSRIAELDS